MLLGRKGNRDRIKSFEDFLSCTFFNNETVTLIPDINNDVLLIGIGNAERPVYEFGDGIQSLIILLYPLFFNQEKNLQVFIEEPETSLHPGMQRVFIETLMRKEFSRFQYFITTHSNHFLDLSLDYANISIFSFNKKSEEEIIIENVSSGKTKILDLIGVRNSSIFLSNSSIWVEGITDRLYLRKFLKLFYKANPEKQVYQEDLHYSFIEYGGSNITHYAFEDDSDINKIKASGISNRILLLVDSDNTFSTPDSAKAKRIKMFEEQLGDNFIKLDTKEIENLLSEKILLQVVAKLEKKKSDDLTYDESKFIFENYKHEYLGKFIDNSFSDLKRTYSDTSGTINNKLKFCNIAIECINSYEDLSASAKKLTEDVYGFISKSNNE
jgi:predicted ATP-dependent endonuclease of OLD family